MNKLLRFALASCIILSIILNSCKKDEIPTLTTSEVTDVTAESANCGGIVIYDGGSMVSERGVCWSLSNNPTIKDSKTSDGAGEGSFTSNLSNLEAATTYYVRAFATSKAGTGYGMEVSFTTQGQVPTTATHVATNVTPTSATLNGVVNANYLSTVVSFEFGTSTSYGQTVNAMQSPVSGNSNTNITAEISGLTAGTIYHFRVKTVNSLGATYGNDMEFTTLGQSPTAITQSARYITTTGATLNGMINANFLSTTVTFEYGTSTTYGNTVQATPSPVTGNNPISVSANLSGLSIGTIYHFRIIAMNELGTTIGDDLSFPTLGQAPVALTQAASHLTGSSAELNAIVNPNWLATTVEFDYGTTSSYGITVALDQDFVTGGSDTLLSSIISGLLPETTYHFRVKATNSLGITFGDELTFTTLAESQISDIDGNVYNTVQIGSQIWISENLKVLSLNDGSTIKYGLLDHDWSKNEPAYCYWLNDPSYNTVYGKLYNWYAVETGKLCPIGWRVPTIDDINELQYYLKDSIGAFLKEIGYDHWIPPNRGAVDKYGFTALPGQLRWYNGYLWPINTYEDQSCNFWTSSIDEQSGLPIYISILNNAIGIIKYRHSKNIGFSIRCIKN